MSTERRSFASYSDFAGHDGAKDLSHQSGEYKPEQVVAGISEELRMAVMSVAVQEQLYGDEEVVVACPGCYEQLDGWHDGLPSPLLYFARQCCPGCDERLHRHELVVTPKSEWGLHEPSDVREFVVEWFRAYQFFGPSRDAHIFRNWEHQDRWLAVGKSWELDEQQMPVCPVCEKSSMIPGRKKPIRLDTDHHDRSTDRVLCLCRECHHYGHNTKKTGSVDAGANMPGDVQDAKAQRYGMRNGTDIKLARYALKYMESVDEDVLADRYERAGGKWRHIAQRINAYSWTHGVDLDARAAELKAVVSVYEQLVEKAKAEGDYEFVGPNDGRPYW